MKTHMLAENNNVYTRCGLAHVSWVVKNIDGVNCKNCQASYYAEIKVPQAAEESHNSSDWVGEYRLTKQNVGKELGDMLDSVNAQIEEVKKIAEHQNLVPEAMVYGDGTFIMLKCNMAKMEIIRAMMDLDGIRA